MDINKKRALVIPKRCASGCRMPGIWRAAAHNEEALVIFHSPKSCAHVVREMDLSEYYRSAKRRELLDFSYTAPLISSNLREEHSIFGGEEQLSGCIDYAMQNYAPEYIVIASSCVAGTIGDDVEAVARAASEKWGAPVLAVPSGGFLDGEYHAGIYYTAQVLIDTFMEKRSPSPRGMVTLLGDRGANSAADAEEIQQLIDGFGLKVTSLFPGRVSVEAMKIIPASTINITLGGKGRSNVWLKRLAVYLKDKFGIPFLEKEYPVGFSETSEWLLALGEVLKKEPAVAQTAIKIQQWRLLDATEKYRPYFSDLKTVLCIARPAEYFHFAWIFELIELLNIRLEGIMLLKELNPTQKNELRNQLLHYTGAAILDEKDAEKILAESDFLLTTYELETPQKQFYLPVLPPLGVGGIIKVMEKMARLVQTENLRSNVVYGW